MLELKTRTFQRTWLPSFDLHEENGELVLHADLQGLDEEVEISVDGRDLVMQAGGEGDEPAHSSRLPLPFPLQAPSAVYRSSAEVLEVRIRIPQREQLQ
ncbi:MAG TPA: hypothetical protein VF756_27705 [Thermoanaerobaculia bacterium]